MLPRKGKETFFCYLYKYYITYPCMRRLGTNGGVWKAMHGHTWNHRRCGENPRLDGGAG